MLLITGEMIAAHLVGDYMLQSDWMVKNKRLSLVVALIHGFVYALPFLFIIPETSFLAYSLISITHAIVDHFGLARYVLMAKDLIKPPSEKFIERNDYGMSKGTPDHVSFFVSVVVDNTIHILINGIIYSSLVYMTLAI